MGTPTPATLFDSTDFPEVPDAPTAPAVKSAADFWRDYERLGNLLQSGVWRFARTMPENPHYYTLREKWAKDDDWVWAVNTLRSQGYRQKWGKSWYTQIDVNEHFFWTMGAPVPITILINRKRRAAQAAYDAISGGYDELFRSDDAFREESALMKMIDDLRVGPMKELSVLDVGCGTGMFLRHRSPLRYMGIDPSGGMLAELRHRHPHAATVRTSLSRFVGAASEPGTSEEKRDDRYDLILSLFGVGSYLTDEELSRIPLLLRPGGKAVTMFYAPGYTPATYNSTKVKVDHRPWAPGILPGSLSSFQARSPVHFRPRANAPIVSSIPDDHYVTVITEAP